MTNPPAGPPQGQPPAQGQGPPQGPPQGAAPPPAPPAPLSILPLPGLEILGRGIRLKPNSPYELRPPLFKASKELVEFESLDTHRTYRLPANYSVNPSPSIPPGKALSQIKIVESWEHLNKMLTTDVKVSGGTAAFTVDVSSNQSQELRSEESAYYATRFNFIPLWEAYVPDPTLPKGTIKLDLPSEFDKADKDIYEKFFNTYGSHVVKRVWVGGKAMLNLVISKSSSFSSNEIRQAMSVSASSVSASVSQDEKEVKERLKSNSDILVNGEGGDKSKLSALRSLDNEPYKEWVDTIKDNPKVTEIELVGIWTLIEDKDKARALAKAYEVSTTFKRISSSVTMDGNLFLVQDTEYSLYDKDLDKVTESGQISDLWPKIPKPFTTFDASFDWHIERLNETGKLFFFKSEYFLRVDKETKTIDPGYPKLIQSDNEEGQPHWPGLPFDHVDAALSWGDGDAYFFSGNKYVRFNLEKGRVDPGYPRPIQPYWSGVSFDRIDAAVSWGNRKLIFFRGDEYIRYDRVEYRADPGYPKAIIGSYEEDWEIS